MQVSVLGQCDIFSSFCLHPTLMIKTQNHFIVAAGIGENISKFIARELTERQFESNPFKLQQSLRSDLADTSSLTLS